MEKYDLRPLSHLSQLVYVGIHYSVVNILRGIIIHPFQLTFDGFYRMSSVHFQRQFYHYICQVDNSIDLDF